MNAAERLTTLRRQRPRDRFLRWSLGLSATALLAVWCVGPLAAVTFDPLPRFGDAWQDLFAPRRLDNLQRFASRLLPRTGDASLGGWLGDLLLDRGLPAAGTTLAVAVVAAGLAALLAVPFTVLGARSLSQPRPFDHMPARVGRSTALAWTVLRTTARTAAVLLRAIPEYLLAIVLTVLGPGAWPAVLALGLHNAGILARLGSESLDDADPRAARAARERGATRAQLAGQVLWPQVRPRLLVFFFYRLESCLRDSVVLGMLGVATLGYLIQNEARARMRYDEMLVYLALAVLLVLGAELTSHAVRRGLLARR